AALADPGVDPAYAVVPLPGSRLAPIFLAGEDESRQFVGWFDKARAENCSFAVAGDGVIRCLPNDVAEARLFADPLCKQRVAAVPACAMPRYLVESDIAACGGAARHRVREP